ncbi:MAG: FkbM family methyltransferase [Verrucomicrobia bacterium]|nr:MAG: FkbM family methyltransferase [Verrucomicrobiota bacterium]
MRLVSLIRGIGNKAYEHAFPMYFLCYRAFKAFADRAERQFLKRMLSEGAVAVDAGANIGIYSQFLSRCVGPTGVVHSFEPSPENFRHLQSATRKLANVRLSQAALGECSGRSRLYLSDKLNVDHRTYAIEEESRRTMPIDIIALDDYFKLGQRVDVIKMDIQGYELHALRGASRVIADNTAIKLLVEFWPYGLRQAGVRWSDLIANLKTQGMAIWQLSNNGLVPFRAESVREVPAWYVNLFASRHSVTEYERTTKGAPDHGT